MFSTSENNMNELHSFHKLRMFHSRIFRSLNISSSSRFDSPRWIMSIDLEWTIELIYESYDDISPLLWFTLLFLKRRFLIETDVNKTHYLLVFIDFVQSEDEQSIQFLYLLRHFIEYPFVIETKTDQLIVIDWLSLNFLHEQWSNRNSNDDLGSRTWSQMRIILF